MIRTPGRIIVKRNRERNQPDVVRSTAPKVERAIQNRIRYASPICLVSIRSREDGMP